jgi:hypothetical protein
MREQADALFSWFQSEGTMKLPALPAPEGISGTPIYDILSTAIHFGTPQEGTPASSAPAPKRASARSSPASSRP